MTVKFPHREPWQEEILQYYLQYPNDKWVVVKSIRQVGKSTIAQLLLVYASCQKGNSVSISVSPVLSQSRKMFDDILRNFSPIIKKSNSSLLEIILSNGSKILFKSSEQGDSIRGETVRGSGILVVDEAAYQNDNFFYSILVPTTNVFKSDIFIFSTPKFKQGFFFDLYQQGLEDNPKIKSFDWTLFDTSKYLSEDTLDIYRKQLPKTAFSSEFLGEFINGDGQVFSDFKKSVQNANLVPSNELYMSIDWSTGQGGNSDDTAICVGQLIDNKAVVSQCIAYNDKKTQASINYIVGLIDEHVMNGFNNILLVVEKNSIGQIYYDLLCEAVDKYEVQHQHVEININRFTTTNTSKKRIIEQLVNLFEQEKIIIPNNTKLINQLSMFEAKIDSNGTVRYSGSLNSHDDCVMSLAFLTDIIYKEIEYEGE